MRRRLVAPIIISTIFMVVLIMAPALALAIVNNPPVADPNGPYAGVVGIPVNINGSGSYDPDPGDSIIFYNWDMDNDGSYDDATGVAVTWTWFTTGTKTIGLKVSDTVGNADFATTTVTVGPNNPPVADPNGPYAGVVGIPVNINGSGSYDPDPGDSIIFYNWDMDNDGSYDDATGVAVTWTWFTTGTKTIGLKVSDTVGNADFATTTVSVTPPSPPVEVGGEVYPVNKLTIVAPWIALAVVIIGGATIAVRRRRAQS